MRGHYLTILFLNLAVLFFIFHSMDIKEQKNLEIQHREEIVATLNNEIEELETVYREYETKLYGIGGAASFPQELYSAEFVFPIAREDFIRFTSPFGYREDPFLGIASYHRGVDIATIWRAQVVSVADGVVVEHYPPPGARQGDIVFQGHRVYGGMIRIDHGDFETLYAHLSETAVRTGQTVSAGQFIGRVGNTGQSRGQHLHLEMFIDGNNINPLLYLSELEYFNQN